MFKKYIKFNLIYNLFSDWNIASIAADHQIINRKNTKKYLNMQTIKNKSKET